MTEVAGKGGQQSTYTKNGNKTANVNVEKFRRNLATVVKAQNDTSKTANITDTSFSRKR